jgi:quercetin dioxygenase-like cupin family protein
MMSKQTCVALALGVIGGWLVSAAAETNTRQRWASGVIKESSMQARFIPVGSVQRLSLVGLEISVRAGTRDTGGALTVLEQLVPGGAGSPLHTTREDKVLTVIEGCVDVQLDAEEQRLGPGATAVIPRGTPHRFHNSQATPARFLMLVLPGGHELFLSALAQLEARKALTLPAMAELGQQYGVTLLPESAAAAVEGSAAERSSNE